MAQRESSNDAGGGLLAGLTAPLRLPERALEALEALVGAAGALSDIRSELISMREQNEPLAELVTLTK